MRRTVLIVATCLLVVTHAFGADDDADPRIDVEATRLFSQIIKDRDAPISTCEIEPEWSSWGVPYDIAHRFLGLNIHADLRTFDSVHKPAEMLVAAGAPKDSICDGTARDRYVTSAIATLKAAYKAGAKPGPRGFYSYKSAYSFPAFDRDFTRAVVIHVSTAYPHFLDANGVPTRATLEGGSRAETYRRDGKGWHKVETIEMSNWD